MADQASAESYYQEQLRVLVWSGFFDASDFETYLDDLTYDDESAPYVESLRIFGDAEFSAKRETEQSWPELTDCDRLDAIFEGLDEDGILALANAGYTTSDAHGDAWESIEDAAQDRYRGFCYYHGQDVERAVQGSPLFIGFDAVGEGEAAKREIGNAVAAALRAEFAVEWDGDPGSRMTITNLDWKRRNTWPDEEVIEQPRAPQPGFFARLFGRTRK